MSSPGLVAIWIFPDYRGPENLAWGVSILVAAIILKPLSFRERLIWGLLILSQLGSGAARILTEIGPTPAPSRSSSLGFFILWSCLLPALLILIHHVRSELGVEAPRLQERHIQESFPDDAREME